MLAPNGAFFANLTLTSRLIETREIEEKLEGLETDEQSATVEPLRTNRLAKLSLNGSFEENVYSCEDFDSYAYVDETERGTVRSPMAASLGNQNWRKYMLTERSREPRGGPVYTRLDLSGSASEEKTLEGDSVDSAR